MARLLHLNGAPGVGAGAVIRPVAQAMIAADLAEGRDVVLPQMLADEDERPLPQRRRRRRARLRARAAAGPARHRADRLERSAAHDPDVIRVDTGGSPTSTYDALVAALG
ncbi:hypothetical protein [Pimelobacter simplex]|uniref:hypothetical protein n=1 Tax=Nocardioides simplex TaxID=2045 RepID=UPI003AAC4CCE